MTRPTHGRFPESRPLGVALAGLIAMVLLGAAPQPGRATTTIPYPPAVREAIQETFHRFADQEIRPRAAEIEERAEFPRELFLRVGELGLFGMRYPRPEGLGLDALTYLIAMEELAWGSMSLAAACTMQSLMGTHFVQRFAEGEVRERLLLPALEGKVVGTICMTEPGAGSDLGAIATRAEERDGQKNVRRQPEGPYGQRVSARLGSCDRPSTLEPGGDDDQREHRHELHNRHRRRG